MTTHSSILAWKIPWMEKPGGLPSMGLQKVGHDWATSLQPKKKKKKKKCLSPIYQENLEFSSTHVHPKIHKQDLSEYFRFKGANKPAPLPLSAIGVCVGAGLKLIRYTWKRKNLQKFSLLDRRFFHATGAGERKCWIHRRGRKSLVTPTQSDSTRNYIFGSSDLSVRGGGMQEPFQQKRWKRKVVSDCPDPLIMWIMTKETCILRKDSSDWEKGIEWEGGK